MVSFTPRSARMAPTAAIHRPPVAKPASAMAPTTWVGAQPAAAWAAATEASPPSTSAPSAPITTSPRRAGSATHRAVNISGAAR